MFTLIVKESRHVKIYISSLSLERVEAFFIKLINMEAKSPTLTAFEFLGFGVPSERSPRRFLTFGVGVSIYVNLGIEVDHTSSLVVALPAFYRIF